MMKVNQAYVGATHLLPPMKLVHLPEKTTSKISEMKTRYDNLTRDQMRESDVKKCYLQI